MFILSPSFFGKKLQAAICNFMEREKKYLFAVETNIFAKKENP